jgi:hypothetical protein
MTDVPTIEDDGQGCVPEVTDTPTIHDDGQGRAAAAETRGAEENGGPLSQSGSQATLESPESSATTPMVQFGLEPLPQGSIISEKGDVYTPPARPAILQHGKPARTKCHDTTLKDSQSWRRRWWSSRTMCSVSDHNLGRGNSD